ncbi:MAG TPA: type II toxin-antitoxin system RelE/ParE family toxin [Gemmatimonadales bacterium]|nr:type II toxin-antitoxin system RelE/ParE family toxin [Gemmatimonadales bacterium]
MASYSLEIKRSAAKELAQVPPKDRGRIVARIQALADDPRPVGAERLSGQERYRVRQGDYRILYEIEDQVLRIMVVKIGHRRDVYRT